MANEYDGYDAGAAGAAGANSGLQTLIANRLMRDKLAEAIRAQQAQESQGQQRIDLAASGQKFDQGLATDALQRKGSDALEALIQHRKEFETETGLKKQQLSQSGSEAELRANLENERLGMENQQLGETGRHNRAQEGIESKRIDMSGANRTVTVRHTDPATGQEVVEYLTPAEARARGAMQAPPTASAKKTMAEAQASEEALKNIQGLYKPEYVGPMAGRMGSFENYTGIGITPERAQFTSAVAALKNQVIHDITGAQMSQAEASRILASVPDVTNPPDVFQARMAETLKNRERIRAAMGAPPAAGTAPGTKPAAADPLGIR